MPYSLSGWEVLSENGELVLHRGWRLGDNGNRHAVLVAMPTEEYPSPSILDRLAHEYELRDQLDVAWAARPLELVREHGQTVLLLQDPGGEPLERLVGPPMRLRTIPAPRGRLIGRR